MTKRDDKSKKTLPEGGIEGFISGLTGLVEKLNDLAQTGKELRETGEFGGGRGLRGIYGVNVKVGRNGDAPSVEPFGNLRKDQSTGYTVTPETLEPVVDLFEEEGYVRVIAEMPGIAQEDVQIKLEGDILILSAERAQKKYRKEILLPHAYARERVQFSCNNGIVDIQCHAD